MEILPLDKLHSEYPEIVQVEIKQKRKNKNRSDQGYDVDEFLSYDQKKQDHKMEEVIEMVKEGEMPLDSYTWVHKDAKLTDDEVAMVMGHEIAHALREHARERMGKTAATGLGANLLSQVLGLGQIGQTVTQYGAQLLTLKFSREDESEADLVGLELAARAGYDPRALDE